VVAQRVVRRARRLQSKRSDKGKAGWRTGSETMLNNKKIEKGSEDELRDLIVME
jgi:hypothetical protein